METGRFMVWVNGSQSSELVNAGKCRPGIAFRDHLYESVPFTGKQPRRPETGIKDSFEEMEHEFPFGIFHPQN